MATLGIFTPDVGYESWCILIWRSVGRLCFCCYRGVLQLEVRSSSLNQQSILGGFIKVKSVRKVAPVVSVLPACVNEKWTQC
jgi:hypothetical protein